MEANTKNSLSVAKQPSENAKSTNHDQKPAEKEMKKTPDFVNYGEATWSENRRKWIGDQSQREKRTEKDPIISWSTPYEDLLLTHDPFDQPIPLPEMVDYLVDIWHDEGLYD